MIKPLHPHGPLLPTHETSPRKGLHNETKSGPNSDFIFRFVNSATTYAYSALYELEMLGAEIREIMFTLRPQCLGIFRDEGSDFEMGKLVRMNELKLRCLHSNDYYFLNRTFDYK